LFKKLRIYRILLVIGWTSRREYYSRYGICDVGFGLWERDVGYGLWVMEYGLRVMGCGLRDMRCRMSPDMG
jgi:hypothetical protein